MKGGRHLEAMAELDTICFDKTGTLTQSSPAVCRVISLSPAYDQKQVLHLAARAETHSQHPSPQQSFSTHAFTRTATGGMSSIWLPAREAEDEVLLGSLTLMEQYAVPLHATQGIAVPEGESIMYVAHKWQMVGIIT